MPFGSTAPFNSRVDAVMFVHGMLAHGSSWLPLRNALQIEHSVCPTLPWSGSEQRYWAQEMSGADWLRRQFDCADPSPRVAIAHSFGSLALLDHLIRQPSQVDRVVLLSPFYRVSRDDFDWDVFLYYIQGLSELIRESITLQDQRGRYRDELLADMVIGARQRLGIYGWSEFLRLFMGSPTWPLAQLRSQCLIVTGETDAYCHPRHCQQLADALPCARAVVIAGAGHFAHKTHAREVARHIRSFLEMPESAGDSHASRHDQEA
jgi:pimeloyl-ACP methyl ester carboxylesterase